MKFRMLAIILTVMMTFSGCDGNNSRKEQTELPSDTPYCRNIMETENGYYYNVARTLSLRYADKETGNDVFLCGKPDCMHDGDENCTATYNNIIVSEPVLYEDYIYFTTLTCTKDKMGCSLYRAAPDGSSVDKVADIAEVEKLPKSTFFPDANCNFIIHRGYAYVPYSIGWSYFDFIQSGLARVDIQTGKSEIITSCNEYRGFSSCDIIAGCGDYVLYHDWRYKTASENELPFCRYNIKTGEIDTIIDDENSENLTLACIGDNEVYFTYFDAENEITMLRAYDVETAERKTPEINTGERAITGDILCYDEKFFFQSNNDIKVINKKGELLGKISIKNINKTRYYNEREIDISDGKLYIIVWVSESKDFATTGYVYCCYIDDILCGNAEWEKAYTKNSWTEYWDDDPMNKAIQKNATDTSKD
ncbi:MAG: hypothetical protein IKV85_06505 [Ruminococcus sp.]|nr:hypothetical protein [Ruminococcus sp.]